MELGKALAEALPTNKLIIIEKTDKRWQFINEIILKLVYKRLSTRKETDLVNQPIINN